MTSSWSTFPSRPQACENRAKLIELAGDEAIVESVFEDEDGVRLYPTGKVQVRFLKPVEPKDLKIFADRHGVTFEKQNRWQPCRRSLHPLLAMVDLCQRSLRRFPKTKQSLQHGQRSLLLFAARNRSGQLLRTQQ